MVELPEDPARPTVAPPHNSNDASSVLHHHAVAQLAHESEEEADLNVCACVLLTLLGWHARQPSELFT